MISLVEIDYPVLVTHLFSWLPGIWIYNLSPGVNTITGSDGLVGYWEGQNEEFYTNIKSLTVGMSSYEKTLS
ncbi:MAG: hypothetical protein PHE51_04970, partial [Eubacteriales bacterium]|nr:hypothetical protein [Eubacteriales bacterium]